MSSSSFGPRSGCSSVEAGENITRQFCVAAELRPSPLLVTKRSRISQSLHVSRTGLGRVGGSSLAVGEGMRARFASVPRLAQHCARAIGMVLSEAQHRLRLGDDDDADPGLRLRRGPAECEGVGAAQEGARESGGAPKRFVATTCRLHIACHRPPIATPPLRGRRLAADDWPGGWPPAIGGPTRGRRRLSACHWPPTTGRLLLAT